MRPNALDHVALWVDDRPRLATFLTRHLGMHEITTGADFTLVGADARRGKLTLFDAQGPRDPGVLERVVLRVRDIDSALAALPRDLDVQRAPGTGTAAFAAPGGLGIGLVQDDTTGVDYDIDHVVLRVPDPDRTARALADLGFSQQDGKLAVADKHVRLARGEAGDRDRPLLNHVALLVDSADDVRAEAERRDLPIEKVVDAANTLAVFVGGPDAITLEYVEHKPGFALT
jgi:catechol 2,3-dioxygenase-like lactoylglutathione lyase family enzyme